MLSCMECGKQYAQHRYVICNILLVNDWIFCWFLWST